VVCPHHEFGNGKLFVQALLGQPHADNRCSVRVELTRPGRTVWFFYMIVNLNNSGAVK
jgi:hypothetical protein